MRTNKQQAKNNLVALPILPPQNIQAEESILGAILLDPQAIVVAADIIRDISAFSLIAHQTIYQSALALFEKGKPTDLLSVTSWLMDHHLLEKAGGQTKLADLIDRTVSSINVDLYSLLIWDKFIRRELVRVSGEIISLAYQTEIELLEILDAAEEKIFQITQQQQLNHPSSISDVLPEAWAAIEKLANGNDGLPTGFYDLDNLVGGLNRGDLVIVAGRPSMGKTAFALNVAENFLNRQEPIMIFSLEMSKEQLVQRMIATRAGVSLSQFRQGPNNTDWNRLSETMSELTELPLFIDDSSNPTISEIRSKCRRIHSQRPLSMVVIDYLQLLGGDDPVNRVQEIAKITRGLKGLARELNAPIVLLSQLNRGVETRTDKRPKMSDLRESGSVEQDADLILMLYRDEYYDPNTSDRGIAEVIISKHRNGPIGTVKLIFDNRLTQFKNLAR